MCVLVFWYEQLSATPGRNILKSLKMNFIGTSCFCVCLPSVCTWVKPTNPIRVLNIIFFHVIGIVRVCYWLPVTFRIEFQIWLEASLPSFPLSAAVQPLDRCWSSRLKNKCHNMRAKIQKSCLQCGEPSEYHVLTSPNVPLTHMHFQMHT